MSASSPDLVNDRIQEEKAFLSRSASYNHLPDVGITEPVSPPLRRTFSDLTSTAKSPSPTKEDVAAGKDILRRTSIRSKSRDLSAVTVSRLDVSPEEEDKDNATTPETQDVPMEIPETRPPEPVARPSKARSMSGRLVHFARKPWISSSPSRPGSPSPSKPSKSRPSHMEDLSSMDTQPSFRNAPYPDPVADLDALPASRKRTLPNKRPRRPVVAVVTQGNDDGSGLPGSPSGNSLRTKSSLEKFSASLSVSTPVLPPMPKAAALSSTSTESPRKKDELWGVFRGLDADYQKFQSKSSALKANVIRSSLIPFLSRHQLHSCNNLRPEDLDRRVNILNKWWTGLLEMLNGKNNQSISGTDRPVYLEAVVGIMTRPEWRAAFPTSHPSETLSKSTQQASTPSENSEGSSGSDILLESIHHNIRNIFIQNLQSQMAFAVERMSMRHAPASLVAFCGKACAYAFFFCPGVADILIRLWNTPATVYRRVLAESSVDRRGTERAFSQDLALSFPMALRSLSFHSPAALVRYLRQKPDVPLHTSQIPWQSPWVSRWCGRDTDLFFVFVKYVHILYADSMPRGIHKGKRILAPGFLPMHAQLLVVLEDTLYKQSVPQAPDNSHTPSTVTFDDFIEGADASVSALPLGAANSHRSMAENRLVILLRDFLSESSVEPNHARLLYAESFCGIMKIAAQRTSLFDHNACFLLCDFLEEVIPIITKYSQSVELVVFDWSFWLDVCRQMMESEHSLTEVRVFSFLFCMWNTWVASEDRKADLCLGFLLHESWFYRYFNHWSSMVRSYFHRLLCWRLARFNDEPSPLDTTIYETLSSRLHRTWEYFMAFQIKANEGLSAPLSSAPCTPAPGRRIIIIRCDNQVTPVNLFVSFDRVVTPAASEHAVSSRRDSSDSATTDSAPSDPPPPPKRKWSILKSMFGVSSSSKSSDSQSPSSSSDESEPDTTNTGKCLEAHPQRSQTGPGEISRPKTAHQPFFFKFSLEWMDRPQWPTRNRRVSRPSLPAAAQLHLQQIRQSKGNKSGHYSASENAPGAEAMEGAKGDYPEKSAADEQTPTPPASLGKDRGPQQVPKAAACDQLVASKYAGRALAEWSLIVVEYDSFFARRRDEGVPCDRMVETPTLGVESFRK